MINEVILLSHVRLFVTLWTVAYQAPVSMGFFQARVLEWVASSFSNGSSQSRDPAQGLNPGLPHCRQTLYCPSHQGLVCYYCIARALEKRLLQI